MKKLHARSRQGGISKSKVKVYEKCPKSILNHIMDQTIDEYRNTHALVSMGDRVTLYSNKKNKLVCESEGEYVVSLIPGIRLKDVSTVCLIGVDSGLAYHVPYKRKGLSPFNAPLATLLGVRLLGLKLCETHKLEDRVIRTYSIVSTDAGLVQVSVSSLIKPKLA